ncbi:MAG: restriction endonuclease [Desulfurococcaceae archaeon]
MSQLSPRRRWLSSERVAQAVLEEMGFKIREVRKKIILSGIEVGEVDVVAEDPVTGEIYAVEVKAGRLDVGGIRQAYVNSLLVGAKPMVVCKGFADDAAKELADKLGVKVIQLSDVFLVESEELYSIVKEVVEDVLTEYFEVFYGFEPSLKPEYYQLVEAIYKSSSIDEAAEKLGVSVQDLVKKVDELKKIGVVPKWASKYTSIRRIAQILVQKQNISSAIEESRKLVEYTRILSDQLRSIQTTLQEINKQISKFTTLLSKLESKIQVIESQEHEQAPSQR